jgi:hypothetical protein
MARSGSSPRRQVEKSWVLDADQIPRPIRAGACGELEITTREGDNPIELGYLVRSVDGFVLDTWLPETPANDPIRFYLDPRPLSFGGARTYLACPNCGRRSLKLYLPYVFPYGFGCRDCHRLAYRSSSQRQRSVAEWRADAERMRAFVERPLPPLPSPKAEWKRLERRTPSSLGRDCRTAGERAESAG